MKRNITEPCIVCRKERATVADGKYSYNWIGILSASGFSTDLKDFVNNFSKPGIGLVLFDVVTKKIYVNKNSDEGKKANSMFLNIGIS